MAFQNDEEEEGGGHLTPPHSLLRATVFDSVDTLNEMMQLLRTRSRNMDQYRFYGQTTPSSDEQRMYLEWYRERPGLMSLAPEEFGGIGISW